MTYLVIVRHGETAWNHDRRLQGQTDWRCGVLTGENSGLWAENAALRKDLEEERARAQKGLAAAREQVEEERARAREETAAAWGQLEAFRRTRRYRPHHGGG